MPDKKLAKEHQGSQNSSREWFMWPWNAWQALGQKNANLALLDEEVDKEKYDQLSKQINMLRAYMGILAVIAVLGVGALVKSIIEGESQSSSGEQEISAGISQPADISEVQTSTVVSGVSSQELTGEYLADLHGRAILSDRIYQSLKTLVGISSLDPVLSKTIVASIYEGWFAQLHYYQDTGDVFSENNKALNELRIFAETNGQLRVYGLPRYIGSGGMDRLFFAPSAEGKDFLMLHAVDRVEGEGEFNGRKAEKHRWFMANGLPYYDQDFDAIYFPPFDFETGGITNSIYLPIALYDAWRAKNENSASNLSLREVYGGEDGLISESFVSAAKSFCEIELSGAVLKKILPDNYFQDGQPEPKGAKTSEKLKNTFANAIADSVQEGTVASYFKNTIGNSRNPKIESNQATYLVVRIVLELIDDEYKDLGYLRPYLRMIVENPEEYIK